jgi:small-conductance mechanosensitive channel
MMEWLVKILRNITWTERVQQIVFAVVIILVGIVAARVLRRRLPLDRLHPQHQLIVRRFTGYVVIGIALAWALQQLGVSLGVVLGAAGLLTVAVGFAAQTSVSNLISGLFLMVEQPFVVGDVIKVADATGEVVSIDLLSVRLRTFDNVLVRIPNESMIKSNVTNLTFFPIRRFDMQVGVAYKEDLAKVGELLTELADKNPICLQEPKPLIIFSGFGDSSINLQFSVWATREKFLELRNSIQNAVKRSFEQHGIEIPFPHRSLYAGSATEPLPVRVIAAEQNPQST